MRTLLAGFFRCGGMWVVVTSTGGRRPLEAAGAAFGGDQCILLSSTESLHGEVVTAIQLTASRPIPIDSVSWFVIVS